VADTRRLTECFVHLDRVEAAGMPYVVVTLRPGGGRRHALAEIRQALALDASVPVLECDVSSRADTVGALRALVARALDGADPAEDAPEHLTEPHALLLTQVGCLLH
jgi:NAD(P)-dependent dehydrogenase (short-subunit alcohol dehydrogenase family)